MEALIEKEEDKKLVLDLWADQPKGLEQKLELALQNKNESDDLSEECCNMVAYSYQELRDYPKAALWYNKGLPLEPNGKCLLNLMKMYAVITQDFDKLVKLGEQYLNNSKTKKIDHKFDKSHYLGIAYIQTGNQKKAEGIYKQLLSTVELDENIGKKEIVNKKLKELSQAKMPYNEIANEILIWFNKSSLNKNDLVDNRSWWQKVPDKVKNVLLKMNGVFGDDLDDASDLIIDKIIHTEIMHLSNSELKD